MGIHGDANLYSNGCNGKSLRSTFVPLETSTRAKCFRTAKLHERSAILCLALVLTVERPTSYVLLKDCALPNIDPSLESARIMFVSG